MKISRYLDAAILKPEITLEETIQGIQSCIKYDTITTCVKPCDIELAVSLCQGTETTVCTVLNFPHGNDTPQAKAKEAELYIKQGASEIDMVANITLAKSGEWKRYENDIRSVAAVTNAAGRTLKVIFETCYLTIDEIKNCTKAAIAAGADFVKTSTGFGTAGAQEDQVKAMLEASEGKIKVKPSGGIRDYQRALMFVEMGCHRLGIGVSSVVPICENKQNSSKGNY